MSMSKKTILALAARLMKDRIMLPETTFGTAKLEHVHYDKGKPIMLVNFRVAMLTGWPVCEYIAPEPTVIQALTEEGEGCWMTDMPCELVQMHHELAQHANGTVLIGGLGLGLVARMVAERKSVERVAVVEKSHDVVNCIWPQLRERLPAHVRGKIDVYTADINDHIKLDVKYDVALLDTWQGNNEMTWTGDVVPMRRALRGKAHEIHAWQEVAMHTQMGRALFRVSAFKQPDAVLGIPHYYALWKALESEGVERVRVDGDPGSLDFLARTEAAMMENAQNEEVRHIVGILLHHCGTYLWERMFGKYWDDAVVYERKQLAEWKEKEA